MTATDAPRIGGRYDISDTLGRGGMATVYRARDTQLERDVAVKLMRADLAEDPVFEARFVNEARNAASISHPNVVTVLDFGTDGPGPYLVMELVEGGELSGLIARDGPLPPKRAAAIAAEVADALEAAHARGIVHRDVKPGNILIAADGHPRVADFGIARATGEQSLTGTGTSLGTVDYFSPEQARGEAATAASDIYALGVVLYEMLTGQRPFSGETPYAVAVARLDAPPPDPRAVRRSIPKALATVVQRAMATDPAARYPSASEMAAALAAWLSRRPTPRSAAARGAAAAGRRSRRRGAAAPAAAAIAPEPVAAAAPAAAPEAETRVAAAAVPAAAAAPESDLATSEPKSEPVSPPPVDAPRRRRRLALLAAAAVLLLAVVGFAGGGMFGGTGDDPASTVVVGEPRGEVLESTPAPTELPTPRPTREATLEPTASPTPEPTPEPIAAATPAPAAPAPPPAAATPPQTVAVAMAVTPDQTVATWYSHVEDGAFDAAYALWSDRMKANFPRAANLDNRWANTADVRIIQLYVAEQTATTAKVQIEFVETKDDGSSRHFIGWWELIRSGDGWLLDWPHF